MLWRSTALVAAAVALALAVLAARIETPTIDEFAHLPAGCAVWKQGSFALYAKNPPLAKLWMALPVVLDPSVDVPVFSGNPLGWGPWEYGQRFQNANRARYFNLVLRARLMIVALLLASAVLLHVWTRRLFGERAAAVASALFVLSPAVIAHGHLATIDVACTFTILLTCFALGAACRSGRALAFVAAGAAWGAALAVKFTALLLLPAVLLLPFVVRSRAGLRAPAARAGRNLALVLVVAFVAVHAAFGFRGTLARLDSYRFHSRFCTGLTRLLPGALPVPLPRDYVVGFDAQKRDTEAGEFPTYFHGEWSKDGFWAYDLAAILLKTPIPTLLLALAGIVTWRRRQIGASEIWPIVLPCASLFLFLTLFNRLDVGVRYLLPLFPFLHMAGGAFLADRTGPGSRRWRDVLALGLVAVAGITALRAHPDHLAYFNALAGGSRHGHEWMLDSNLDWGQDLYRVPAEVARRKPGGRIGLLYFGHVDPALYGLDYYPVPPVPVEDVVAVSVAFLMGMQYPAPAPGGKVAWVRPDHLAWLRSREPVARLGSIWVFDTRR